MGPSGRNAIKRNLSEVIKNKKIDFAIINGENAADDGKGITKKIAEEFFSLGIDVYNGEPNIHPEYLNLPNVFVLPHLGSSTMKTRIGMGNLAVQNIEEFFKTGKCSNKVN